MTAKAPTSDHRSLAASRLRVAALLEALVRLAGGCAVFLGRDSDSVEMRLRGSLISPGQGLRVGRRVRFVGSSRSITIGRNVTLYGDTFVDARGPDGRVEIGSHSHIDLFSVLYGQGGLTIGNDCAIAAGVLIYTQTNKDSLEDGAPVACQPTVYAKVSIGAGSWIGAGVKILPGVSIGPGTHVGSGAVVTKSLPEYCVAIGMPAKPIRTRAH
jgi:acetyltransferase-like isoleucine patch superfamily enzyme